MDDIEAGHVEACGGGPTVAVLVAARKLGARSLHVLHRTHSGAITGDNKSVVGYLAAVVVG
jgi:AmmeMemoRadiSam system protein B